MLAGGWGLAELQEVNLPEDVDKVFTAVTEGMVGASYTPVLYAGQQVVQGFNYMVFCKQVLSDKDHTEHLVKMVVNVFMDNCSIVEIETII